MSGNQQDAIERTDVATWARRLPGGAAEVERDEKDRKDPDKAVFASLGAGFRTYEDAAKTSIPPDQQKAMHEAMERLIARARTMKTEMEAKGDPIDLPLIEQTVFSGIPRGLVPPEFVKELQSWRKVRDAMLARAVMKGAAPPGRAEKLKDGLDKAGTGNTVLQGILSVTSNVPGVGEKAAKVLDDINNALEVLGDALQVPGNVIDGKGALDDEAASLPGGTAPNPVALKIADEKLIGAMGGLFSLGADVVTTFVPTLAIAQNGVECGASMLEALQRFKLRAGTGDLKDKAMLDTANQLSRAFEQARQRETRQGVEASLSAATSGMDAAAGVATATGVGAKVGVGITIASKITGAASKLGLGIYDEVGARKAIQTLDAAQAGDTAAQETVFADHAHYAKMLIAISATEGNALARTYLVERELTPEDMDNPTTTADILFDYAVMKSGETDEPSSKIAQAKELAAKAGEALFSLAETCRAGLHRLLRIKAAPAAPLPEVVHLPSVQAIRNTWDEVADVKELQAAIAARDLPTDRELNNRIVELTMAMAEAQARFIELRSAAEEEAARADEAGQGDRAKMLRDEAAGWQALDNAIRAR